MKALWLVFIPLIFIAAATTNTAWAEPIPFGCYVTDEERNWFRDNCGIDQAPTCYQTSDGSYSFLTPANTSAQGLVDAYGDPVYSMIRQGYESAVFLLQCDKAYKSQVALVKKLKRACGSKCRRIK